MARNGIGKMKPKYGVCFPNESIKKKFKEILSKLPKAQINNIYKEINKLAFEPRPKGKKIRFLKIPVWVYNVTAQFRLRVGKFRILYDIDDKTKKVWLLAIRKRSEKTYE